MSISAIGSGLSGMQSFQRALDVSANNVANLDTNGFKPQQAEFQANTGGGVNVQVSGHDGAAGCCRRQCAERYRSDVGDSQFLAIQGRLRTVGPGCQNGGSDAGYADRYQSLTERCLVYPVCP